MLEADRITYILLQTPAWARLALTAPDDRLRKRGASAMSDFLLDRLEAPSTKHDERQLALPIL